jgi:alkanesulfonate monooxygenase SsuD/methylene tetrahydromethanopterin reductase-like flavin-dependent oxidoreductase (luciferase family)
MRVGISLNGGLETNTTYAQTASEAGFDTIFIGELWGADAFVQLTHIANLVEDVNLATGIVNVYSRTPAVLAMASYALHELTDGRFSLGLGVSTPTSIENTHGLSYERPIRRMHEVIEAVTRLHSGEGTVSYEGELLTVKDVPAFDVDVPIFNSALGSANRRVTGRLCDGWLPHMIPFKHLEEAFETIAEKAQERGRNPDNITVAPWIPTAVNEDAERAQDHIKRHIAYYAGISPGYNNAVARGYPDEAEEIYEAWQNGEHEGAREIVTNDMIRELGIAGTPETAREQLTEIQRTCKMDMPSLILPRGADDSLVEQTIQEIGELL